MGNEAESQKWSPEIIVKRGRPPCEEVVTDEWVIENRRAIMRELLWEWGKDLRESDLRESAPTKQSVKWRGVWRWLWQWLSPWSFASSAPGGMPAMKPPIVVVFVLQVDRNAKWKEMEVLDNEREAMRRYDDAYNCGLRPVLWDMMDGKPTGKP